METTRIAARCAVAFTVLALASASYSIIPGSMVLLAASIAGGMLLFLVASASMILASCVASAILGCCTLAIIVLGSKLCNTAAKVSE